MLTRKARSESERSSSFGDHHVTVATRVRLRRGFEDMGFRVSESHTNFVFADIRRDAGEFAKQCRQQGVTVGRPFPPLNTWIRVTTGTDDEVRQAIDVFRKVLTSRTTV